MWIINVSKEDIELGKHPIPDENTMLIQIVDPAMFFPIPVYNFKETHQFEFLDLEENDPYTKPGMEEFIITDLQAQKLVTCLNNALHNKMNVIVHCVAGLSRSGGVVEVGIKMGFEDTHQYRYPNQLVISKMLQELNNLTESNQHGPSI